MRLPIFGFHATCRLYSQITLHQNPKQCIYDNDHMITHWLHNTGWSASFNGLMFKLAAILCKTAGTPGTEKSIHYPNKILVVPRAIEFRSRERLLIDKNSNLKIKSKGGWYWSNPDTCPEGNNKCKYCIKYYF